MKITAIIVVKNNPPRLFESLESIKALVSEIIIGNIDIGNDYKKRLLNDKKIKLIDLPSDTPFADLVKEDLKKRAKGDYILYLDPDEIFPKEIISYLQTLIEKHDYIFFPRKNIIFGKWIQQSRWWPDYQLRLFKKNSVIWPKELHPVPKVKGKEFKFEAKETNALLHYNYDNLDQYLEKAIRYAKSEAKLAIAKKEKFTLASTFQKSITEFISRFFALEGYKDGMHGLVLSILQMFYYFLAYFYFWEMKKYAETEKNTPKEFQTFTKNLHFETSFWLVNKNLVPAGEKMRLKIQNKLLKIFK
ncbi:hypothetical protein A2774_04330 [Candidatus Roizmanbacteria bacterium RIFCSPHIGHO2_01_FULL_39_12c]|uniref:Glycosyltransferase 2-like domain-containing protein n=1 Tax=Candidatus Roizmanbacteria bacterium RIFCSPHIGHO2_01_FULL_39_12c TaxID=1802031 RepID=A0A1F7G999_9BACT|nr:MAG: hypothetical protein A2774_04330 [Candidatus Roizmanbacteria bacterium RIFCSPHIGHO2_01_FULL_39_12c]OGK47803.1 MAG: hypothetical protein A2963_03040 [Candidatus Roizmanbacteria bacterium RIFCSPLOWO2_01_FULL_40_13]